MKVTNVGQIGHTYDCPTINCPGETTNPDVPCIGCHSRTSVHRLPFVAEVIGRRHLDAQRRADLPATGQSLSAVEHEVLLLVAEGLTNREIAARRRCEPETIKTYLSRILDKLGARTRGHAVLLALRQGVIE